MFVTLSRLNYCDDHCAILHTRFQLHKKVYKVPSFKKIHYSDKIYTNASEDAGKRQFVMIENMEEERKKRELNLITSMIFAVSTIKLSISEVFTFYHTQYSVKSLFELLCLCENQKHVPLKR